MAYQKREGNFQDQDKVLKKSKVNDTEVESEKGKDELETCVSERNQPASYERNGMEGSDLQHKLAGVNRMENHILELNSSSEDKTSCNPEFRHQDISKLTHIEADAAEDKGSRHTMEDAWVVLPDATLGFSGRLRCAHFAVYDGHGGRLAAEFVQNQLHANVLSAGLPRELMDLKTAKKAILEGFRRTDESLLQESAKGNWQDGATAVCVWILGQTVLVANIGDAKAVLARSSAAEGSQRLSNEAETPLKAIVMTREHKAIYPQERARILKAGGSIGPNGRLQGRLEVSRAFGDRQFKKVGVIATPDVHSFELTEREHFIILGCDGLWGVFGPSDAVDFVHNQLKEKASATIVARRLVKEAVRERRCKDNCTAVVIVFRHR